MLFSLLFLEISYGQLLLWVIIISFAAGIIRGIAKNNERRNSPTKQKNKSDEELTKGEEKEISHILSEIGVRSQASPFIKNVKKFDDFYNLDFSFPQNRESFYRLSLNVNFDGSETQRSLNTAEVMSMNTLGGVELSFWEDSGYFLILGAYTVEMGSDYEDFILMQAETKYHKLDVSTRYRILFEDNSYWDFESEYAAANDFTPTLHRQVFGINKEYSHKLETVPIKNLFIYQDNRTTKYTLGKEDQIRIQQMMTMHYIAAQSYFVDKKELP